MYIRNMAQVVCTAVFQFSNFSPQRQLHSSRRKRHFNTSRPYRIIHSCRLPLRRPKRPNWKEAEFNTAAHHRPLPLIVHMNLNTLALFSAAWQTLKKKVAASLLIQSVMGGPVEQMSRNKTPLFRAGIRAEFRHHSAQAPDGGECWSNVDQFSYSHYLSIHLWLGVFTNLSWVSLRLG